MTDRHPVDPVISSEVSAMFAAGRSLDETISRMRALGLNKIDSIKLVRDHHHVPLGEAKDIVHLSPAWADRYESDEAFHDAAEQAITLLVEQERSAA